MGREEALVPGNCIEAHYPHFDGNWVPFIDPRWLESQKG